MDRQNFVLLILGIGTVPFSTTLLQKNCLSVNNWTQHQLGTSSSFCLTSKCILYVYSANTRNELRIWISHQNCLYIRNQVMEELEDQVGNFNDNTRGRKSSESVPFNTFATTRTCAFWYLLYLSCCMQLSPVIS